MAETVARRGPGRSPTLVAAWTHSTRSPRWPVDAAAVVVRSVRACTPGTPVRPGEPTASTGDRRRPSRGRRSPSRPPRWPCWWPWRRGRWPSTRRRARRARRSATCWPTPPDSGPSPGRPVEAPGRAPDLLERRLRGAGRRPSSGRGHALRRLPGRGGPGTARDDRTGLGRHAGRGRRPPGWPARSPTWWPWPPSGPGRRWSARTTWRRPVGPVRRAGRRAAGVRAVRPVRLGARGRGAGRQAAPLDRVRRTRPPPTATSASPARSCGSTRWPACCAAGWPTGRSGSGRPGRGRPWPRRCWPGAGARSAATVRRGGTRRSGRSTRSAPVAPRPTGHV